MSIYKQGYFPPVEPHIKKWTFFVSVTGVRFKAIVPGVTEKEAKKNALFKVASELFPNRPAPIRVHLLNQYNPTFHIDPDWHNYKTLA